ncbi:MAG: hypothetical protein IT258_07925 [Saprospiraceae bacterium]|nr:hypothetical protein [Saprospiraceae bacterium]
MFKMLFWGLIAYVVYRYFQMKDQLKEGRHREYMQQHEAPRSTKETPPNTRKDEGEFIDYEELK